MTDLNSSAALLAISCIWCLAGCAAPPPPGQGTVSGQETEPVETSPAQRAEDARRPVVRLPDGFTVSLELAETPEEIEQGLMFRPTLPDDQGMLFVFDMDRVPAFWMKNTLIPLDLVFLAEDGRIADIIPNARPCKIEPCPRYIPRVAVRAALEVAAGVVEGHGLAIGDRLEFEGVDGFPVSSSASAGP